MSQTKIPTTDVDVVDPSSPLSQSSIRTTHLTSAYDGISTADRRRVTGFISKDHYNRIFGEHLRVHGMQGKVIAGLMFAFVTAFERELTLDPTQDPYELLVKLINNAQFHP